MTPARNPRRAYDKGGCEIPPMTLGNMRSLGVRSVSATCEKCSHEAGILVDALPDDLPVPDVALRLRCSACGSKAIKTVPRWTRARAGSGECRFPGCGGR
jgi:hypothetical protein